MRADVVLAILGMAAATYFCRAGGYAVLRAFGLPPFVQAMLRNLPGPIFAAYVTLALAKYGPLGLVGALGVVLVQRRTGSLALSIPSGILIVWLIGLLIPAGG